MADHDPHLSGIAFRAATTAHIAALKLGDDLTAALVEYCIAKRHADAIAMIAPEAHQDATRELELAAMTATEALDYGAAMANAARI
jgi:hypothetical protein